jgi:hypothetical protein
MAKKQYQYTIYRTNGDIEVLPPCPKKEWSGPGGLYELIGCHMLEAVPKPYYPAGISKRAYVWCDEEGLFKANAQRNPHFGNQIVGDAVAEEVYHG